MQHSSDPNTDLDFTKKVNIRALEIKSTKLCKKPLELFVHAHTTHEFNFYSKKIRLHLWKT